MFNLAGGSFTISFFQSSKLLCFYLVAENGGSGAELPSAEGSRQAQKNFFEFDSSATELPRNRFRRPWKSPQSSRITRDDHFA
jgi:hypothetical protein